MRVAALLALTYAAAASAHVTSMTTSTTTSTTTSSATSTPTQAYWYCCCPSEDGCSEGPPCCDNGSCPGIIEWCPGSTKFKAPAPEQ